MLLRSIALLAASVLAFGVHAQADADYPAKPIRFIIPFPPGASTNDILGRAMALRLSAALGQQLVVDNRPGAGGTIGTGLGAKAPPDGYTLVAGTGGPIVIAPHVYSRLPYRPLADLAPVMLYAMVPYAILANPAVKANDLKDLIALAKAQPGRLRYASSGNGGAPHLCMELFKSLTGVDLVHIPYKGGAPAALDVLSGQVELYCPGITSVMTHIKSGRLKTIAVTMPARTGLLPDASTSGEQGHPDLLAYSWAGILAPARTPAHVIERLRAEMTRIMGTADMKALIAGTGADPVALGPREFGAFLRTEYEKWGKVAKAAKLRVD